MPFVKCPYSPQENLVDPISSSLQKDLILHKDTFTKAELLRTPGSLANVKEVFSLNQV